MSMCPAACVRGAPTEYARLASRWLVVAAAHRTVGSGRALPLGHPSAGLGEAVTDSDGPPAEGVALSAGRSPVLGASMPCRHTLGHTAGVHGRSRRRLKQKE